MAVLVAACLVACGASEHEARLPFTPAVYGADEGCRWAHPEAEGIRMNEAFIAPPGEGEDRDAWVGKVRAYRDAVRSGGVGRILALDYDGVRAWTRLAKPVAKALALGVGESLHVAIDTRRLKGNCEVCIALDVMDAANDEWVGWSTVLGTLPVPPDGAWHRVETSITVSDPGRDGVWFRPIIGMDGTHDASVGAFEFRDIRIWTDDAGRMTQASALARELGGDALDLSLYDRADLAWTRSLFTCRFTFMYDRSFYTPENGYAIDAFLDDGQCEFGGYDAVVLWQAYPRLGFDDRNQFDMYHDMPGGIDALRGAVRRFHERGVKVFLDYNPWDRDTRRPGKADEEVLAELVATLDADGLFLDTLLGGSQALRDAVDRRRAGVVFAPEGHPAIDQLGICSASWAQWLHDPDPPGMLHLKWIQPRHMQHQIRRWDSSHQDEIATAFFNGSGMLVWENVFGTYNPWPADDRALWYRAVTILRAFADHFTSDAWSPFYPTLQPGLYAHAWPGAHGTLWTVRNTGEPLRHVPLFEVSLVDDMAVFDLWNGREAEVALPGDAVRIVGDVDVLSCFVVAPRNDARVRDVLTRLREPWPGNLDRNGACSVVDARAVEPTPRVAKDAPPPGMVYVAGASVRMRLEHVRRECGCYPDPGAAEDRWREFLWGSPFDGRLAHDYVVEVAPFAIDETEVTNADFKRFLDESGYRPACPDNFLKHWPIGPLTDAMADLPVVYVDLDDARAYARWAGKRLPTEAEWHLAAQGTDGRAWPWGDGFDASRCHAGSTPVPVRSMPEGRSPYGCYHMSGNTWEWTESERDDGHTRFAILRGGSYFKAEGSVWYVEGGPQPCTSHAKFLLMAPGLDRCATLGFRCVVDVQP
ncbi:MAG TPA: SUMF1/EgtB/PvdO family nonheme iron enzyme [Candidatus Hydrogenedentes bacterium]|nr:SUMF1/EgtB/PvdO family nonheme iron enzyme [Candidatus Hydrogenedentota bacterium]HPG70229.1 SUMF1/EgtB/PvdO family nonheme iron enzyme [Candidatus Hydrogenedentota bacterium]